jgi:hypothetical protein
MRRGYEGAATSQDLLHLMLVVEWTKSARLVRKTGNRLALLDDAPTLPIHACSRHLTCPSRFLSTSFARRDQSGRCRR